MLSSPGIRIVSYAELFSIANATINWRQTPRSTIVKFDVER